MGIFWSYDMEKADFHEAFSAMVECPYCKKDIELDLSGSRWTTGEVITCTACAKEFELGESL